MEKKYCAAPWRGLHINPQGVVKTCCAGNPNITSKFSGLQSVDQVLNGNILREVRAQMKQGILHPKYCSGCIDRERISGESERYWHNGVSEDFNINTVGLDYEFPVIIDARWSRTCNLSCNYCDAANSSSWSAILGFAQPAENRKYIDDILNLIEQHKDKVKEVALVGGEPLLLKENVRVLEAIKGSDTKVVVITNLSNDLETNKIFKLLSEHRTVGWSMSFDNIGEQFEYVRYGANWQQQQKNINKVLELMHDNSKQHDGGVHAVYNLYNCTNLVKFKAWARDMGLTIHWQALFGPDSLAVKKQNQQIKDMALEEIERVFDEFEMDDHEAAFFSQVKQSLLDTEEFWVTGDPIEPGCEHVYDTIEHIRFIEETAHPDTKGQFEKLWPEIYQALGPI